LNGCEDPGVRPVPFRSRFSPFPFCGSSGRIGPFPACPGGGHKRQEGMPCGGASRPRFKAVVTAVSPDGFLKPVPSVFFPLFGQESPSAV